MDEDDPKVRLLNYLLDRYGPGDGFEVKRRDIPGFNTDPSDAKLADAFRRLCEAGVLDGRVGHYLGGVFVGRLALNTP